MVNRAYRVPITKRMLWIIQSDSIYTPARAHLRWGYEASFALCDAAMGTWQHYVDLCTFDCGPVEVGYTGRMKLPENLWKTCSRHISQPGELRSCPKVALQLPNFAPGSGIWTNVAQMWPRIGQFGQKVGRIRPRLANIAPSYSSPQILQSSTEIPHVWPIWAKLDQISAGVGQHRRIVDQLWADLGEIPATVRQLLRNLLAGFPRSSFPGYGARHLSASCG